ncbi:GH92 family glycosyl hydrolase [Curtobacterium sp. PhB136]|uniref:GH92 family glycosyl hydrolase n=1 Tax=Curtobacterium sp. PhB136 TaxID=2485181 RepID=UPI001404FC8D|nr:GH92 family glycosyl hydrolase [Curtobacterium sp. PhB136]
MHEIRGVFGGVGTRVAAIVVGAAIASSGALLPAVSAHAASGLFSTSFESGDAQPLANTPLTPSTTVTGSTLPVGSLLGHVTNVTADAENAPNEVAANLADGNAGSKWLAFQSTGVITYQLDHTETLAKYSLTSANDSAGRDPKGWTLAGSNDGSTWTTVDTQSAQSFSGRGVTNDYAAATPGAYSQYRLSITQNSGDDLTQLADWSISDGSTTPPPPSPMVTQVGNGPVSGLNIRSTVGFSGTKALRYSGAHVSAGEASATNVLYQDLSLPVTTDTELSYKLFPELGGDTTYPATYAAVDLELSDGSLVSADPQVTDENGNRVSAKALGDGKVFFVDQWNSVRIPLGALAGKTVTKVLFTYDDDAAGTSASTKFQGWVDDIRIDPAAERIDGASLTNYVDTRRGTNSSGGFSRGNNIPAAAVPNGFNFWTPMTDASSESWEYSWQSDNDGANLPQLQGIGVSHEPSPWMGDRNQLAIMPSTSGTTPDASLSARALAFDHNDEVARPDLYSVKTQSGLVAEVTPSDHGAVLRFAFPKDSGSVVFDNVSSDEKTSITVNPDGAVSGWTQGGSGLSTGATRMFFSGTFDHTPNATGTAAGDRSSARYASFSGLTGDHVVELRLSTSFISLAQAKHNADLELTGKSFNQVQHTAASQWNDRLGVVTVPQSAASDSQLQALYGSLYRMNLYPNSQFENTGTGSSPVYRHASPNVAPTGAATDTTTNAVVKDGKVYVNNGFWDTYRTVWPLYSMLYPKVAQDLVDGFVQQYRDGGWTPRWSSPGYADLMTGTSSDVAFANAYVDGAVDTATALEAFDAGFKNATTVSTDVSGAGRKALDQSAFLGYVPDSLGESVSWGLEGTINDAGLAKMAEKLATDPATPADRVAELETDAAYLADRSKDYVNLFDQDAGFFQGRDADGDFQVAAKDFDPAEWGGAFTETDGWNFAFHAPFDVQGLAGLYGGDDQLIAKLKQFYATPETAENVGSYGGQIHEMLEARSVRIGQLGMSNQVSHHIPYVAAAAGDPSLTQQIVRESMRRLFVGSDIGQGYTGDEDNGEMSSWFVYSALGLYPLAQGSGQYTIGSPLFSHATVHLDGGDLHIDAAGNSASNVYVQSASLDGKPLDRAVVSQADIAKGGSLDFTMGAKASTWGNGKTQGADGLDTPAVAPKPLVDATTSGYGETTSDDGTAIGALTDDESLTATTFGSATPAITWKSAQGPVTVDQYTLTTAASGTRPMSWKLEGSSDGTTWVPLSTVAKAGFTAALQTRPFTVAHPAALSWYRLTVTGTDTGKAPSLGELELLADSAASTSTLSVNPTPGLTAQVDEPFTGNVAAITGAGTRASDYTVTVDWQDGKGPQTVTPTKSALGAWEVPGEHVFDTAGAHTVHVVVRSGTQMVSTDVPVAVSRTAPSLQGAYDNVCLGDPGQAGNCDFESRGFSLSALAADGFVQGATNAVTGTDLTFDLPAVAPGDPDNATGNGQTVPVPTGTGVTELSVIGTANERGQQTVGTITYSDGTTADFPIAFGDWTASIAAPQFGDTLVATSDHRTVGVNGSDTTKAGIFATPVFTVPDGKRAVSITLPVQTGSPTSTGRIHVFAIATNGTRVPVVPLAATAGPTLTGTAGTPVSGTLATATGGAIASGTTTATVNWGDGTPLEAATVTVADGTATVTGKHTYTAAVSGTATVTVDDGTGSASVRTRVEIAAAPVWHTTLTTSAGSGVRPGGAVHVTGTGFAPGESVAVRLDGSAVRVTVTADRAGALGFDVKAPRKPGNHAVSALGATSATVASATFQVVTPGNGGGNGSGHGGGSGSGSGSGHGHWSPEFHLLASSGTEGTVVGFTGSGFAAGERVSLTLHSKSVALGTTTANADGVVSGTFTVPAATTPGAHEVEALGATSQAAVTAAFRVLARPASDAGKAPANPGNWNGLAYTGTDVDPARWSLVAGALVALGAALITTVAVSRRRRSRLG